MCEHVLLLATIWSTVPLSKLIAGAWVKISHRFAFEYTLVTFPSVWVQKLQDFQTYWLLSSLFFLERKGGNVWTDSSQTRCGRGGCIQMCLCVRVCMYSVSVCVCMCCFSHLMLWCFSMAEKVIAYKEIPVPLWDGKQSLFVVNAVLTSLNEAIFLVPDGNASLSPYINNKDVTFSLFLCVRMLRIPPMAASQIKPAATTSASWPPPLWWVRLTHKHKQV